MSSGVKVTRSEVIVEVTYNLKAGVYIACGVNLAGLFTQAKTRSERKDLVELLIPQVVEEIGLPRQATGFSAPPMLLLASRQG